MADSTALIRELTETDGVSGFEGDIRAIFARRLKGVGDIVQDRMGGIVVRRKGGSGPRVMLDCHLDEIGFIIQHVTKEGFLKFLNLGGWTGHVLGAQRVTVHGDKGTLPGIIGSTPPHFLPPERREKALQIPDMFIDIGAGSREQAEEWGVRTGSWAVPFSPFTALNGGKHFVAKAFDNRLGCALAIECTLLAKKSPNILFMAGSTQEEVGLRGASATAELINPDVAIVLECPPADDTPGFKADESQGALGKGVQIRAYDPTMIASPKLIELALATAREEKIPHQLTVRATGGTNAGKIHLHRQGVPSMVLGVPARGIHSHTAVMDMDDFVAARRLVLALLARLDRKTVAGLV